MTWTSKKGWVRLGIVLSVTWLILMLAYAAYDYYHVNSREAGWETVGRSSALPVETRQTSLLTECGYEGKKILTTCSTRYVNLALLVLVPIASGWLIVYLIVYAVRWVLAGFSGKEI
jgi:hypothetical protein